MRGFSFILIVLVSLSSIFLTGCSKNVEKTKDIWNTVMSEEIDYEVDTSSIKDVNNSAEMKEFMKDTLPLFLACEKKQMQYLDKCEKFKQITLEFNQMMPSSVNKQNKEKIISNIKEFTEQQDRESKKMADELLEDAKVLASRPVPKEAQPFYVKAINTLQLNKKIILEYAEKNGKICDLKINLLTMLEDNSKDVEKTMDYADKVNAIVKDFKEHTDKLLRESDKQKPTKEETEMFNKKLKEELDNFSDSERGEYAKIIKSKGLEEFFLSLFSNNVQSNDKNTEMVLGNIYIGQPLKEVMSILGEPIEKSESNAQGEIQYEFNDIRVGVTNGLVTTFISESEKLSTKRGVKQSDLLDKVIAQYGDKPYGNSQYGDVTLYEYKFLSDNGDDCLLRFAIKNGVVDYISGRVLNLSHDSFIRHTK